MKDLYDIAWSTIIPKQLKKNGKAGHVACALEAESGAVFTGICIDVPCSIGICAEQSAIAEMLKHGETKIKRLIAVYEDGSILPPCGRCRELISQLDFDNEDTVVAMDDGREITLKKLLPERWDRKWDSKKQLEAKLLNVILQSWDLILKGARSHLKTLEKGRYRT